MSFISMYLRAVVLFTVAQLLNCTSPSNIQPNIVFMFADDLGFNDVGYHGNTDTKTPFIDQLALEESLILSSNYVMDTCSPTRSAFFTGRYPSRLGIQNQVFDPDFNYALTRQVSFLANEFQNAGYVTHAIGYDIHSFIYIYNILIFIFIYK